jgi:hypothetical protein
VESKLAPSRQSSKKIGSVREEIGLTLKGKGRSPIPVKFCPQNLPNSWLSIIMEQELKNVTNEEELVPIKIALTLR